MQGLADAASAIMTKSSAISVLEGLPPPPDYPIKIIEPKRRTRSVAVESAEKRRNLPNFDSSSTDVLQQLPSSRVENLTEAGVGVAVPVTALKRQIGTLKRLSSMSVTGAKAPAAVSEDSSDIASVVAAGGSLEAIGARLSDAVERILCAVEKREAAAAEFDDTGGRGRGSAEASGAGTAGVPLTAREIGTLSLLCASLPSPPSRLDAVASSLTEDEDDRIESVKMGWAAVEGETLAELSSLLERHVRAAAAIDLVGGIAALFKKDNGITVEMVSTLLRGSCSV